MMKQLRIAIDGRSLQGQFTGVGTYTSSLLEQLLLLDSNLTILLITDGSLPAASWAGNERVQVVKTFFPVRNNFLWTNLALRRQLSRHRCDLFHSPGYTLPLSLPVPSVVTIHDVSYATRPDWYPYKSGALRKAWYRLSALRADCILTDSEFSRREIVRVYGVPVEKVFVASLGVDPQRFRRIEGDDLFAGLRQRYMLRGDFLLFVGDIHRRRNVTRILQAFGSLKTSGREFQNLELVVVGRNLDSSRYKDEIPPFPYGESVHMLGYVPAEDLPLFYTLAKAFVFPSFYEGFGLGVLEAMACGCPVIVSRGTACEEVAGDAAICVDPNDTKSIADAIESVLRDPAFAARHSQAGLERSEQFRWSKTAEKTRAVYHRLR